MLEEVIERIKAGTPEADIAEWLASKLRDIEIARRGGRVPDGELPRRPWAQALS